jgi:hypothetical protein
VSMGADGCNFVRLFKTLYISKLIPRAAATSRRADQGRLRNR